MPEAPINTRRVRDRRELRFASAADALHDIDGLLAAERAGTLLRLGNWTPGQALSHIAAWACFPYDGYPPEMRPSAPIRVLGRLLKRRIFAKPFPAGVRIPGAPGGTWGVEDIASEEGAARCRRAFERLGSEPPRMPNPLFGPLSHQEWIRLNLSHAELHLSYFRSAE